MTNRHAAAAERLYQAAYDLVLEHLDDIDEDDAHFVAAQLLYEWGAELLDQDRDWKQAVEGAWKRVFSYAERNGYRAPFNPFDEEDWDYLVWCVMDDLEKVGNAP